MSYGNYELIGECNMGNKMSNKIIQFKLTYPHYCNRDQGKDKHYQILSLVNTIEFVPNQFLNTQEVDELCKRDKWNIQIVGKK